MSDFCGTLIEHAVAFQNSLSATIRDIDATVYKFDDEIRQTYEYERRELLADADYMQRFRDRPDVDMDSFSAIYDKYLHKELWGNFLSSWEDQANLDEIVTNFGYALANLSVSVIPDDNSDSALLASYQKKAAITLYHEAIALTDEFEKRFYAHIKVMDGRSLDRLRYIRDTDNEIINGSNVTLSMVTPLVAAMELLPMVMEKISLFLEYLDDTCE